MESLKKTESFIGNLYEGADDLMLLSTDDKKLVNIGRKVSNSLSSFDKKRVKLTVTIEIEEL